MIRVTKVIVIKNIKDNFVKPNDFHVKKKKVFGKYKQLGKFKNKFNMLKIDKDRKSVV